MSFISGPTGEFRRVTKLFGRVSTLRIHSLGLKKFPAANGINRYLNGVLLLLRESGVLRLWIWSSNFKNWRWKLQWPSIAQLELIHVRKYTIILLSGSGWGLQFNRFVLKDSDRDCMELLEKNIYVDLYIWCKCVYVSIISFQLPSPDLSFNYFHHIF